MSFPTQSQLLGLPATSLLCLWRRVVIFTLQVANECIAVCLVEEGVNQRIHTRGDVSHPNKEIHEMVKMVTAALLTDGDQHVGDEERTPHHQEEKKYDTQDFGGPLLISDRLHHSSSTLIS